MSPNNLIRQIIRESVRKRLGLISEAVTVKNDQLEMTVTLGSNPDGSGDSVVIKNKTVEDITSYGIYGSDNEQDAKPLKSGSIEENEGHRIRASGQATFSVAGGSLPPLTPQSVLTFSCKFAGGFATFVKADTGRREDAAAAAATAKTDTAATGASAGLRGYFGEYKIGENSITVVAKRSETVVSKMAGKAAIDLVLRAGESANVDYKKGDSVFIFRKDYADGQPFDLISNGAVTTKVGENEVDPTKQPGYEAAGADPKGEKTDAGSTDASSAKTADSGAKKGEDAKRDASLDPQAAAATVQDKIRTAAMAVNAQFDDLEEPGAITLDDVKASNNLSGHVWISNSDADRSPYKLSDWSAGSWGSDKYTYFALVEEKTGEPVAFVVASDPETNKHFSTGRYIGPNSQRQNLRRAFCKLYHRATGKPHETCDDGSTKGPEDDFPKGAGGGRGGKGKGSGKGSGAGTGEGPGAQRLVSKDGHAVRGRGDPLTGILGIGHRAGEKLRRGGYKIITKAKDNMGFTGFPEGPNKKFVQKVGTLGSRVEAPPSGLGVIFQYPMAVVTDAEGTNERLSFGKNTSPSNIKIIRMGWGAKGRGFLRGKFAGGVTVMPGDEGFDEAAAWILSQQKEFDLAPDAFIIEDEKKNVSALAVAPAENKGETMSESAVRRSRQTMSITPLFDRYRF